MLRKAQGLPMYRALARRVGPAFFVCMADERDWVAVRSYLHPGASADTGASSFSPSTTNFVARRGTAILGWVQLVRNPQDDLLVPGHWLFSLFVRPQYRGMSVGDALCRRVVEMAMSEGAGELRLRVNENNLRAIRLYRKLLFEEMTDLAPLELQKGEQASAGQRYVTMRRAIPGR